MNKKRAILQKRRIARVVLSEFIHLICFGDTAHTTTVAGSLDFMSVKHKNVLNNESKSNRPASIDAGKLLTLQSSFRAAGMTNAVTVTPALAARCGWTDTGQPEVDFGVVAWVTAEALAGSWPCCHRRTDRGKALLLEFPAFLGAHAISLEMAIIVREDKVELLNPEELNHPPRVLLAEDDSDLACVLCALLERAGFKTIHSSDGLEAWHLVQTQPFDIVILDIDLPGLSGIEVCRHIKGMPTLTHLPVVFCSGGHDLDKLTKQAGADGHVEKPAGLSQLVARLNGLLCKPLSLRPSFIKEKNAKHKNEA